MKYLLPILVILTSVIGSLANVYINSDDWYTSLIKSSLNPPSFVFGIVWPILYVLMGIIAYKLAHKIQHGHGFSFIFMPHSLLFWTLVC